MFALDLLQFICFNRGNKIQQRIIYCLTLRFSRFQCSNVEVHRLRPHQKRHTQKLAFSTLLYNFILKVGSELQRLLCSSKQIMFILKILEAKQYLVFKLENLELISLKSFLGHN